MLLLPSVCPHLTCHNNPRRVRTLEMTSVAPTVMGTQRANSFPMPWRPVVKLKQSFGHTNLLLQLVAAVLFHGTGLAFSSPVLRHCMIISKATAIPWAFVPYPSPQARVCCLLDIDSVLSKRAPPTPIPPSCITPHRLRFPWGVNLGAYPKPGLAHSLHVASTACSPALLDAFPIAQHYRFQIPQREKSTTDKFKKKKKLDGKLKDLIFTGKDQKQRKSNR